MDDLAALHPLRTHLASAFETEKTALRHPDLAPFRRNPTTWELLIGTLAEERNIQQAIFALDTDCLGYSSLIRFVNNQIADGRLVAVPGQKRSEKILRPSPQVAEALMTLISPDRTSETG